MLLRCLTISQTICALCAFMAAISMLPPVAYAAVGADAAPVAMPRDAVDSLNHLFGPQTIGRAIHAKGIVLTGRFVPTSAAARISKAAHFKGSGVEVTARFSDFAGIPNIASTNPLASPRGFALKFHLPDGSTTDLVTHSYNGFPTPTPDEFVQLITALASSGPEVPHPTPAEHYLGAHPVAKTFLEGQIKPPVSYATVTYYGVNSFQFTNLKGAKAFGRYRIVPEAGEQVLSVDAARSVAANYLSEEIRLRVSQAPIRFRILLQMAAPGDVIADPSVAWPDSRPTVDLGEIVISGVVPDSDTEERALMFLPAVLPLGIEPADPMINFRSQAYPVSYGRRHQ